MDKTDIEILDQFVKLMKGSLAAQEAWKRIRKALLGSEKPSHNTASPKYPKFEDFWKSVPFRGEVGCMTRDEIEQWSKTVFEQSRL